MMIMIKISCFNILSMDIKSDGFVSFSLIVIDCFFTNKISFHHRLESGLKFQEYPRLI